MLQSDASVQKSPARDEVLQRKAVLVGALHGLLKEKGHAITVPAPSSRAAASRFPPAFPLPRMESLRARDGHLARAPHNLLLRRSRKLIAHLCGPLKSSPLSAPGRPADLTPVVSERDDSPCRGCNQLRAVVHRLHLPTRHPDACLDRSSGSKMRGRETRQAPAVRDSQGAACPVPWGGVRLCRRKPCVGRAPELRARRKRDL